MFLLFLAKNIAVLALLLVTSAAAGTLVIGSRAGIALRSALGLAMFAHACFFLALIGQLRSALLIGLVVVFLAGGALRMDLRAPKPPDSYLIIAALALGAVLVFLLALFPAIAFDETLYHLPFVRAFAHDGALRYLPDLRFPVFPVLHELLCVPPFLFAGDIGTHLTALAQLIITAALLIELGARYDVRAGWLAAAIFLGSPLVIWLGTVLYSEIALTLFIVAGFYALDRDRYVLAGFFFGSACSVKYLALYFAVAAMVITTNRLRSAAMFAVAFVVTALPMTGWILFNTRNPLFPYFGTSAWVPAPSPPVALGERAMRVIRLIWDVTFARQRMGLQPPVTPFLAIAAGLILFAAIRDAQMRWLVLLSAGYIALFNFLPQDSRYLVPLLALVSIAAALIVTARWPGATILLVVIALSPGIAYAGYRLTKQGIPPTTAQQRSEWLVNRLPELRALRRAGAERTYACGAERLKTYALGDFLGDVTGPYSYARILSGANDTQTIVERMRQVNVRYFLVAKRVCAPPRMNGGMELVYEDADAQLWQVAISRSVPPRPSQAP